MRNDRLIQLGEKLIRGDADAAEELFRAYSPYLRMVVRRQMTPRLRARSVTIRTRSAWERFSTVPESAHESPEPTRFPADRSGAAMANRCRTTSRLRPASVWRT